MHDRLGQLRLRFAGLELRAEGPHGQVYAGRDFTGGDVTVVVLADEAAADPGLRSAFADVVQRQSVGSGDGLAEVYGADLHASPPWAAVRQAPGRPGAEQLLAALGGAPLAPATGPPADVPAGGPPPVPMAPPPGFAPQPPPVIPPPAMPYGSAYPARQPNGTAPALAGGVVVALLVLVGVGAMGFFLMRGGEETAAPPVATAEPGLGQQDLQERNTPAPEPDPAELERPQLREAESVTVLGPSWQDGEETYTMALPGWPYAFRTPPTWGCLRGSYDAIPEASAWQCIDEQDPGSGQRVNVMLWECPTTCTEQEQADMVQAWLDEPDRAVWAGSTPTAYVETARNDRERFSLDLSHFAADPADPDGPLRWHVGVYAESPSETRDDVLKAVNDLISQAS